MIDPVKSTAALSGSRPLRVMIVDDSVVMRGILSRMIVDPDIAVVASVGNGLQAVERAKQRDVDVVVLDVEMPILDGLAALPQLLAIDQNLVVIMASSLTTRNADISLRALAAGAKDYIPKPSAADPDAKAEFRRDLTDRIKSLGFRYRRRGVPVPASQGAVKQATQSPQLRPASALRAQVLAVGSSTGGPVALARFLKDLPKPLKVPLVITQHMPPTFTALLAENLTRDTGIPVAEAKDGEPLKTGRGYVAPGDHHMTIVLKDNVPVVALNQLPKENFCRPAVDPMARSLVAVYGRNILMVMLTGMGQDGLLGAQAVVQAGGVLVAQDEQSSVVWGMPGAVAKAGICSAVLPLNDLGKHVGGLLGRGL